MLTTPKGKGELFLASSLCDGLEDNDIKQVTTLLLNKEADPNVLIPSHGITPFHLVIGNDSEAFAEEVTKLFLRHGGNPNVKSVEGLTPVHVAAAWGRVSVLELLLASGGDPLCLDDEGRSPFHYAFDGNYHNAVTLLGTYCEDWNEEEDSGCKITFDKLLINNGTTIAEYIAVDSFPNELKHEECQQFKYEFSFDSNSTQIKEIRETKEKEKCLINEIINQLSTSLNFKEENLTESQKFFLKTKKKRSVTPRYKRKVFNTSTNLFDDTIISKSPNFPTNPNPDEEFFSPISRRNISNFTPSRSLAKSTPRRKKFQRSNSFRKQRKNYSIKSVETSPDSPDFDFGKVAVKLQNKYEDDSLDFGTEKMVENLLSSSSCKSYISVQEEYKYEDPEEGVTLLEKRLYTIPGITPEKDDSVESTTSMPESFNLPAYFLSNESLRKKLLKHGQNPGPITDTTRQVYLKRLTNILTSTESTATDNTSPLKFSSNLSYGNWVDDLETFKVIEEDVFKEFSQPDVSKKWREGTKKNSFNYLLLDPRITMDLSKRKNFLKIQEIWNVFIKSIFYVGKGTRTRPHAHLYDAFRLWVTKDNESTLVKKGKDETSLHTNGKVKRILDIWNSNYGVICLRVYDNTIPVEAYTREAAMIDALGTTFLQNCKRGNYYGIASTWTLKEKCNFGRYLLYKSMKILLHEGERQILPTDL